MNELTPEWKQLCRAVNLSLEFEEVNLIPVTNAKIKELEEAVFEQSVLLGVFFAKDGISMDSILEQLFTDATNVELIRQGIKHPKNIEVLERILEKRRTNKYEH